MEFFFTDKTSDDDFWRAEIRRHEDEEFQKLSLRVQSSEAVLLQRQSVLGQASRVEDRGHRMVLGTRAKTQSSDGVKIIFLNHR